MISTPLGALDESCTTPLTVITDSFLNLRIFSNSSGEIFLLGAVTWITPSQSLRSKNIIPPKSLNS